jgi:hypothetical protein
MQSSIARIEDLVGKRQFRAAVEVLTAAIAQGAAPTEFMHCSRWLSSRLRSRSMDLAYKKATEGAAEEQELGNLLSEVILFNGEDVYGHIADGALRAQHLPRAKAPWAEIKLFALTLHTQLPLGALTTSVAIQCASEGCPRSLSLSELRLGLWLEFRRHRLLARDPDAQAMERIHALVEELRRRLPAGLPAEHSKSGSQFSPAA